MAAFGYLIFSHSVPACRPHPEIKARGRRRLYSNVWLVHDTDLDSFVSPRWKASIDLSKQDKGKERTAATWWHAPVKWNRWTETTLRELRLVARVEEREEPEIIFVVFMFSVLLMWGFATARSLPLRQAQDPPLPGHGTVCKYCQDFW